MAEEGLNLFQQENKIRKIVSDMMGPTIRRSAADHEEVINLRHEVDKFNRQIEEVELNSINSLNKVHAIDNFRDRMTDSQNANTLYFQQIEHDINMIKKDITDLSTQIQTSEEWMNSFDLYRDKVEIDVHKMQDIVQSYRVKMKKLDMKNQAEYAALKDSVTDTFQKRDQELIEFKSYLEKSGEQMTAYTLQYEVVKRSFEDLQSQLREMFYAKENKSVVTELRELQQKKYQFLKADFESVKQSLQKKINQVKMNAKEAAKKSNRNEVDSFIQISEVLFEIFDPISKRKLAEQVQERLEKYKSSSNDQYIVQAITKCTNNAKIVLDTIFPVPEERQRRSPTRRYSIFQQKPGGIPQNFQRRGALNIEQHSNPRSKRISMGTSESLSRPTSANVIPDSLVNAANQRLLTIMDLPEPGIPNPQRMTPDVDVIREREEDVAYYTDSEYSEQSVDSQAFLDEIKVWIYDAEQRMNTRIDEEHGEIVKIQEQIEQLSEDFGEETSKIVQSQKKADNELLFITQKQQEEITSNQASFTTLLDQMKDELKSVSKQRKRDTSSMLTQMKQINTTFSEINTDKTQQVTDSSVMTELLSTLVEVMKIQHSLDQQDEVDRRQISLMGQKDNQVVSLDKT